jgi:hypothetical protein
LATLEWRFNSALDSDRIAAIGDEIGGVPLETVKLREGHKIGHRAIVPSSFMISQMTPTR